MAVNDEFSIYLCGRYARRAELLDYKAELEAADFGVTSRWLLEKGADIMLIDDTIDRRVHDAQVDIADILAADAIVQFSDEPVEYSPHPHAARGGRHFELGFAFARGLLCIVVGPRENIFHYLPTTIVLPTFEAAREYLIEHRRLLALADDTNADLDPLG